jgi:predicted O-methyltransferase YrrM
MTELVGKGYRTAKTWDYAIKPDTTKPIKYLEIGLLCGHNLVIFEQLYGAHPDSRLYGIDPWDLLNTEYNESYDHTGNMKDCFQNIVATGRVNKFDIRKGFSYIEVQRFDDNFFDFVYIDGNHNPANVLEDAVLAFRKLKSGGILIFDDYDWPSVKPAIDRFAEIYSEKLTWLAIVTGQNFFRKN